MEIPIQTVVVWMHHRLEATTAIYAAVKLTKLRKL